jgi:hypothetical protein
MAIAPKMLTDDHERRFMVSITAGHDKYFLRNGRASVRMPDKKSYPYNDI